jgi:hypothetical protein
MPLTTAAASRMPPRTMSIARWAADCIKQMDFVFMAEFLFTHDAVLPPLNGKETMHFFTLDLIQ